jgi:hypothetical protein
MNKQSRHLVANEDGDKEYILQIVDNTSRYYGTLIRFIITLTVSVPEKV